MSQMFFPNEINPTGDSTEAVYSTWAWLKWLEEAAEQRVTRVENILPILPSHYVSSYPKRRFPAIMILSL